MKNLFLIIIIFFASAIQFSGWGSNISSESQPAWDIYVNSWEQKDDALLVETVEGLLTLRPYQFGALHYQLVPFNQKEIKKSYAVINDFPAANFKVDESSSDLTLTTENYKFVLNKFTGSFNFYNNSGKLLLHETSNKRESAGDSLIVRDLFKISQNEALYGLGQFRDNKLNLRGAKRELIQFNTQSAVPVVYSTAGWGMFWDNPSRTVFNDNETGMSFTSDCGTTLDYYLFAGNTLDELVSSYRELTGVAPMLPYWALGYHQSRNKYATQDEVLEIAKKMQQENIQMSSIFIDYFYWQKYGTGSHKFDENLFPNPEDMLKKLHNDYDTKAIITVWPTFKKGTLHYDEFESKGMLLDGTKALDGIVYDVFNPEARKLYWQQILPLIKTGFDGWFLDGPEPDLASSFLKANTFVGPAKTVVNLYPLMHVQNFYNNLRELYPDKRPYILTRCAWASQQRTGSAIWSGDIPTTFDELQKQVVAGLNFTATGIPYWTTDIGGYAGGNPADESYRELYTRWFEYGTFCPVFRSHGRRYPGDTKAPNELWAFGDNVQKICTDYINLRYFLMPYIYTLTADVTHKNYTPMRLLAFDYQLDSNTLDCKDQFMYGSSMLVCPVLNAGITRRKVYLPAGNGWVDFWTGKKYNGGQTFTADAPKEKIPLFIKAGAIIPTYLDNKKNNTLENPIKIFIFKGENGYFELYKDDGKSYEYTKNNYAYIPFSWNDEANELVIDAQKGEYDNGKSQEFQLVVVDKKYKNMNDIPVKKIVRYTGSKQTVKL